MRARSAAITIATTTAAVVLPAVPAGAATITVCHSGCTYSQLAPALAAAHDGDTIKVGRGTYAGGVTITTSITLRGAGSSATVISGGGPVLTVGAFGASSEPRVAIAGVTIRGGVTRSSQESEAFVGKPGVLALGGGIEVPPDASQSSGAEVTITDSVVSGNQVAPTATVPSGLSECPRFPQDMCPFAIAGGGGINTWGPLTIRNSTISGNRVGAATSLPHNGKSSDANGAGIWSLNGPLTITNSLVTGNRARAVAPNGRFGDGGGLLADGGITTLRHDTFSDNAARLDAALTNDFTSPDSWLAIAGGAHISGDAATVTDSRFVDNRVVMTNSVGDANAFSGGLHTDMDITVSGVVSSHNTVISRATGPGADAVADSGAGEISGSLTDVRMSDNTVAAWSRSGLASAVAGAAVSKGTLTDSTVRGNTVRASASRGDALADGGGLLVGGPLTIRSSTVAGDTARIDSGRGAAKGGGIYDASVPNGPPGGPLTLVDSRITGNRAVGPSAAGGGIFASGQSVSRTASVVRGNRPDQCVGC